MLLVNFSIVESTWDSHSVIKLFDVTCNKEHKTKNLKEESCPETGLGITGEYISCPLSFTTMLKWRFFTHIGESWKSEACNSYTGPLLCISLVRGDRVDS